MKYLLDKETLVSPFKKPVGLNKDARPGNTKMNRKAPVQGSDTTMLNKITDALTQKNRS
jgi:hypothetical protein